MQKVQHTRESIIAMLDRNPKAVERAIVCIYNNQTSSEKSSSTTIVKNNQGFRSCDARYGSYCANWILKGNSLSGNHLIKCRKLAKIYVRQLLEKANSCS